MDCTLDNTMDDTVDNAKDYIVDETMDDAVDDTIFRNGFKTQMYQLQNKIGALYVVFQVVIKGGCQILLQAGIKVLNPDSLGWG